MAAKRDNQRNAEKASPAAADEARKYQAHVPAEIRNVSFPVAVRGYDRDAVEAYTRRVNRVIAELEVTRSPQAAVRHAVERVGEQTKQILEEARESAERITVSAQSEADGIISQAKAKAADLVVGASTEADRIRAESEELVARSKAEAEKLVADAEAEAAERKRQSDQELAELQAQAEARRNDVETDTAKVWDRRRELLGDIDRMAGELHEAASEAAARLSQESPEPRSEAQTAVIAPSAPAE
jgi:DivIVA domain-containing protein